MANAGKKQGIFQRISRFIKECWLELKKTSWPSSEELTKSTLIVLAAMLVIAIWIGGLDALLSIITKKLVGW
jgi:preprotein translocase subunit SecE